MRAYSRSLLWGLAIVAVIALALAAPAAAAADDDLNALLEAQTGVFDSEALALTSAAFDADQDEAMMETEAEAEVEADADAASERRRWRRRVVHHRPAPVRHVHRPAPVRHVHRPAPVRHVHRRVHRPAPVRHVHRAVHRVFHRPRHVHRKVHRVIHRHVHRPRHVARKVHRIVHRKVHRPHKVHHVRRHHRRHRRRHHRKARKVHKVHRPKKHKIRRAIRRIARKVHRKARKVARKVHRKAKKIHRKARKAARKIARKARKVQRKVRRAVRKAHRAVRKAFDIKVSPHGYRNRYISDWGYAHNRQWIDVRGAGVKNDYGRWVGNHPHIWYSVAVHECPNQYTGRGEFLLVGGQVKRGPNFKGLCPGSKKQAAQVPHVKVPPPAPRKSKKAANKPYKAKHHRRYKHEAFTPKAAPPPKTFPKVKHAPKKSPPRAPPAPPAPKVPKAEPPVIKRKPKTGGPSGKVWKPESKTKGFRAPPLVQKDYPHLLSSKAKEAKQESAQLSCPSGKVIEVRDATYGRGFGVWQASGYISKGQCHAHFARDPAAKMCNGKSECAIEAADSVFGNPCPDAGKTKELLVVYRCVKTAPKKSAPPAASQLEYPGIKVLLTEANKDAQLKCSSGKVITVLDASFGSGQGLYASNGHIKKGACHAPSSALTVMKACHGKSTCKVDADEPVFAPLKGECGPGPAKQLKVTYHCGKAREFVKPAVPPPRKYEKTDEIAASLKKGDVKAAKAEEPEGDGVVRIGGSEVHIHVTQQSMPEPNADALREVESNLDGLHSRALGEIEGLLSDIESHRVAAKPCLKKLKKTIHKFKTAFVQEASKVEKITHKYSYADDAPTLAL